MHIETVVAVVLTANAALCALVPVEVKARQPLLWKVLDALALNVKHATNRLHDGARWQQVVSAVVVGAVCALAGLHETAPAAVPPPQPEVLDVQVAPLPADATPCAAPTAVTPSADATATADGGADA